MTELPGLLALALGITLASALASIVALVVLTRLRVVDNPTARSSHRTPIPRGGGIGFMAVGLIALVVLTASGDGVIPWATLGAALLVTAVSFADDLRSLPAGIRLLAQALAVIAGILVIPGEQPIIAAGAPLWLDRILLGLTWLWFINLFNFMDGIDGIAAGQAATIGLGVAVLAFVEPAARLLGAEAVVVGATALGFLAVNWPPARLFMGDAGSIGLGYLLGWLLISLAASGHGVAALILPLVFVADASTTLLWRAAGRRPLASPHRDHAYQMAVDRGRSHAAVTGAVIVAGLVLVGLAVWSTRAPEWALAAAAVLVAALLAWFRWGQRGEAVGTSSR